MIALLAGLGAFVLVGGVGAAIFLATSGGDDKGKTTSASVASTGPETGTAPVTDTTTTDTGPTTTQADKPANFVAKVCGALTPDNRCSRAGFTRSANVKQFYIWVRVRNGKVGEKVSIGLRNLSTGSRVVKPATFKLKNATSTLTFKITGGPFAAARFRITIKYAGSAVNFKPPLTLTLK
jgi:hypothetical protein